MILMNFYLLLFLSENSLSRAKKAVFKEPSTAEEKGANNSLSYL